jgi:hypothetical protein
MRQLWEGLAPFLAVPRSAAPIAGLRYIELLLESGELTQIKLALSLSSSIEQAAWSPEARNAATQARLRALVLSGNLSVAAAEARLILDAPPSNLLVSEACLVLAQEAEASLRLLRDENPRWKDDDRVLPEHDRLRHLALDLYLRPPLSISPSPNPAARGLWGALSVYSLCGDHSLAIEAAKDLLVLYPDSPSAMRAKAFLAQATSNPHPVPRREFSEQQPTTP